MYYREDFIIISFYFYFLNIYSYTHIPSQYFLDEISEIKTSTVLDELFSAASIASPILTHSAALAPGSPPSAAFNPFKYPSMKSHSPS